MAEIRQLDPHVADLIAAGEVVERPASVVKELVENAIDAGASQIAVEIQRGGMALIRVTDNGCGMAPEQLPVAFLRHATSKLRTAADLAAIGTLGFRGEALAATAAVARVDVFTRERGAAEGARLSLEGGAPGRVEPAGCPEGTTMVVRDLFFNTPARMKFMKKDTAEASAVTGAVQHLALSNPHISFRLVKDGAEVLHTPGDNRLDSTIYAVYGRDFALGLVPVEGRGDDVAVSGYVTKPLNGRGTRGMQVFFVNGRLVRSQLLTAAVEEAYKNQLMKGKFPGCVLHLTVPMGQVDVNVHPAKTVVKFVDERQVFSAVYHVVQDALDRQGGAAQTARTAPPDQAARQQRMTPRPDFYRQMDAAAFREAQKAPQRPAAPFVTRIPPAKSELGGRAAVHDVFQPRPAPQSGREEAERPLTAPPSAAVQAGTPPAPPPAEKAAAVLPQREPPSPAGTGGPDQEDLLRQAPGGETPGQTAMAEERPAPWRLAGEVLRTYIIAEDGEDVWLIDKHAAHERMNFDRLKAGQEPIVSQSLLAPEAVRLAPEDMAVLLEQRDLLEEFGFQVEEFGPESLLVRAVPAEIEGVQAGETLEMLAEKLRLGGRADPAAARDAMLHTMACKAAIKGGWVSDRTELQALVGKVQSGEIRYCPHGRPVAVKLTRYELEKMFKRA